MDFKETQINREEIYNGRVIHVVNDIVKLPNNSTSTREVILHNGAVCIIPIKDNGNVILERQYRYAVGRTLVEIPAGKLEPGEDPAECAKRELEEETGYLAGNLISLGDYFGSPALLSEHIWMFLATDLTKGNVKLDEDEFLEVFEMPLDELIDRINKNEIPDGKTQLCAFKARKYLKKNKKI